MVQTARRAESRDSKIAYHRRHGMKHQDIADKFSMSVRAVKDALERKGLTKKRQHQGPERVPPLSCEQTQEAVAMLLVGHNSVEDVACHLNVPVYHIDRVVSLGLTAKEQRLRRQSVDTWLKKRGLDKKRAATNYMRSIRASSVSLFKLASAVGYPVEAVRDYMRRNMPMVELREDHGPCIPTKFGICS